MKQLKVLSYLLMAVLCLSFASCNDDDLVFEENMLYGEWESIYLEGFDYDDYGQIQDIAGKYEDLYYYFDEDGSGEWYNDYLNDWAEFDWTLKNGNQVTLKYGSYSEKLDILRLDDTTLIIESYGRNENGPTYTKIIFVRIFSY